MVRLDTKLASGFCSGKKWQWPGLREEFPNSRSCSTQFWTSDTCEARTDTETSELPSTKSLRNLGRPFCQLPDWCAMRLLGVPRVSPFNEPTLLLKVDGCLNLYAKTYPIRIEDKEETHHCRKAACGWPLTLNVMTLPARSRCCTDLRCCWPHDSNLTLFTPTSRATRNRG